MSQRGSVHSTQFYIPFPYESGFTNNARQVWSRHKACHPLPCTARSVWVHKFYYYYISMDQTLSQWCQTYNNLSSKFSMDFQLNFKLLHINLANTSQIKLLKEDILNASWYLDLDNIQIQTIMKTPLVWSCGGASVYVTLILINWKLKLPSNPHFETSLELWQTLTHLLQFQIPQYS